MKDNLSIALIGNPNCGKTTLFNAYTGAKLKTANWPGVTVEKKEKSFEYCGRSITLTDLPGTYSLASYTAEEALSRQYILGNNADVVLVIADASTLERNLYLTLQLIELGRPTVLALNMIDTAKKQGISVETERLSERLGIPVIPISARKRTGLKELMSAATDDALQNKYGANAVCYKPQTELAIKKLSERITKGYPSVACPRWLAVKLLERDKALCEEYPVNAADIYATTSKEDILNRKLEFIERLVSETVVRHNNKPCITDKADAVLLHPVWSIPIFAAIMALVFFATFTLGDAIKVYFERMLEYFSEDVRAFLACRNVSAAVSSLVVDGIIAGVGSVLTFLPNIFILFLALAFLEDSGYMARVACIADRMMSRAGLSGKAFIPLILGFGCSVPAVMATRTLENGSDKIKAMLAVPFMSCSARLPVYVLFAEAFFAEKAMLAAYSMYIIGIMAAVAAARLIRPKGTSASEGSLIIELPDYRLPDVRGVLIYVGEKLKDYITKAGTTIFIASVLLWLLLKLGPYGTANDINESYAAYIGRYTAPLLAPAGLGYWQLAVALLSGLAAKEVVVSSMGVLFGIDNILSSDGVLVLAEALGKMGFTTVNAYSMMLFCLLYVPCLATVASIKRESGSLKYTWLSIVIHLLSAWSVSSLFFGAARLIRFIFF